MTCRVRGCSEKHKSHYCRLCGLKNSTHFSQDCPQGRTLYHGTRLSSIKGISYEGLRPSTQGRLGPGVYFAESYKVAETISLNRDGRDKGNGAAVFECNVNLGKIKNLKEDAGSKWQNRDFDSARSIHPRWAGAADFIEFCLKDHRKCSVRKVAVTEGHIDGLGTFVINKLDRKWKELRQLDDEPTFNDVRNISQIRLANLLPSNTHLQVPHQNIPPHHIQIQVPRQNTAFLCSHIGLKVILFLITGIIQVGNAVVQKNVCGYYSPAIISHIVFLSILTAARIIYCIIGKFHRLESWYSLFCFTLALTFLIEMPMMVSDAYVVNSCGRMEAWSLALHVSYIGHLWLTWILDCIFLICIDEFGCGKFIIFILLSFLIPPVMYVPVYLKLGDKAYDFQLDISKIQGDSTDIARFIRILLIHIGTIGWGSWCVAFAVIGIALIVLVFCVFCSC